MDPRRHPRFYYGDGNVFFVGNDENRTKYRVHATILSRISMGLDLPIPSPYGPGSETSPFEIPTSLMKEEFEALLHLCYTPASYFETNTGFTKSTLIAILKMSHMFVTDGGRDFAIGRLDKMHLPPAELLYLSRSFGVERWIQNSVDTLIHEPLYQLTDDDIELLGIRIYAIISRARDLLTNARRQIALYIPGESYKPSEDKSLPPDKLRCDDKYHENFCLPAWRSFWTRHISLPLLDVVNYVHLSELNIKIATHTFTGQLSPECKTVFIQAASSECGFRHEDEIVEAAAKRVKEYINSLAVYDKMEVSN